MSKSCPATAKCECGRIYSCPLPKGHDGEHPTELDECRACRTQPSGSQGHPGYVSVSTT